MTCIIGLEVEGAVWMGCDSASANGWNMRQTSLSKVFRNGDALIGYTTSFRMGQILEHHLKVPGVAKEYGFEYMVTEFVPAVRECLKEHGFTKISDNREEGGQFLVGVGGKLYIIDSDFQVNRHSDGFEAIGSGACYALGAMGIMKHFRDNPEKALLDALAVAARFSNGVSGPFHYEVLDG